MVGTGANMSVLEDNWVLGVPPSRLLSGLKSSIGNPPSSCESSGSPNSIFSWLGAFKS